MWNTVAAKCHTAKTGRRFNKRAWAIA